MGQTAFGVPPLGGGAQGGSADCQYYQSPLLFALGSGAFHLENGHFATAWRPPTFVPGSFWSAGLSPHQRGWFAGHIESGHVSPFVR